MEFLNRDRTREKYADDPLAPAHYTPDTLFATVMFSNPLGWFETSNLPEDYFDTVLPLVECWRAHREELFAGTILPVGNPPDGMSYTGFLSIGEGDEGLGLVFREANPYSRGRIAMEEIVGGSFRCEVLAGKGACSWQRGTLKVEIPPRLGYVFFRFTRPG
jgi:alpha-galactosidase